ncbi:hypothetical protein GOODEAATRI_026877 [Goodea atripinnis]|uniref:Uncharacterized protein n=1 Tax=Goodea atripinnis TaxID=208336 RepID=A0ABV0ML04_9TELE
MFNLCNATVPSMELQPRLCSSCMHHVAACVRSDASACGRASHLEETPPRRQRVPSPFPAQWSPGSSLDLSCKSFIFRLDCSLDPEQEAEPGPQTCSISEAAGSAHQPGSLSGAPQLWLLFGAPTVKG